MLVGFLVRFDDLKSWQKRPGQAFYQDKPLLTTFDGYFYLNLSRDLLRGEYDAVDEKQVVPVGRPRPYPPPLLAVLGAVVTKITGASLDMVGTVLPAVLGVLLAIPLYFLGSFLGGRAMGMTAALSSLFFPYYVYRSNVGWFDTDCMNVTFATLIVYCTLQFAKHSGRSRYFYGAAAFCCYLLFLWWWDQAFAVVSVIFLSTSLIALGIFYRPEKKEGYIFYGIMAGLLCILFFWQGIGFPQEIYNTIAAKFDYIYTSKTSVDIFPNQAITVSEQVRPGFDEIVAKSTGSMPIFLTACVGLGLLFYRRPKDSLFLIVPLLLASLSFLFAKRFLIFLNPITALGLGSFISVVWSLRKRFLVAGYIAPVLVVVLVWPNFSDNLTRVHWPKEPGALVAGMAAAEKHTPDDAVIWTWWDHGYNMRYWADRGVIADGSHHGGQVSMYNAMPLTVDSEQLSANFMHFYVRRGQKGMTQVYSAFSNKHGKAMHFLQNILAGGPGEAENVMRSAGVFSSISRNDPDNPNSVRFYFPETKKPVYLFLDWRLTITSYWWFWFGSWDFDKLEGVHPAFELFQDVGVQKNKIFGRSSQSSFQADLKTGIVKLGKNKSLPTARISFFEPNGKVKEYKYKNIGLSLEASRATRSAALVDSAMESSVFNRLYLRRQSDPKYFNLVAEDFPAWQLWKVDGDK